MVALMRADHPLAAQAAVGPRDLAAHAFVGLDRASRLGFLLQNAFQTAGVAYTPQVEVRYCHTAAVLAQSGQGVAVVDVYTAAFLPNLEVVQRRFEPGIEVSACLLTRSDRPLSQLAGEFVQAFVSALNRRDA
jgi:DNA-binding transcriptional LysR family regulator